MSKKISKTNAMRKLDSLKIPYEVSAYEVDGKFESTQKMAEETGKDLTYIYKTIVTISNEKEINVFVVNGGREIDMKKAAALVGAKSIQVLPTKDLKKVTGYERGGTTSLAMKKDYPVYIDNSCEDLEKMSVSAGKIGLSLILKPDDLRTATGGEFADFCQ